MLQHLAAADGQAVSMKRSQAGALALPTRVVGSSTAAVCPPATGTSRSDQQASTQSMSHMYAHTYMYAWRTAALRRVVVAACEYVHGAVYLLCRASDGVCVAGRACMMYAQYLMLTGRCESTTWAVSCPF